MDKDFQFLTTAEMIERYEGKCAEVEKLKAALRKIETICDQSERIRMCNDLGAIEDIVVDVFLGYE